MATPPDVELILLDAWDLRCIFNHSQLVARLAAGELTSALKYPRKKPGPKRPSDADGTVQQSFLYFDLEGNEVATVHYWHLNGVPVSDPDPKAVRVEHRRFVVYPDERKDPEKRLKYVWLQKCYGWYRKLKCYVFGPLAVVPRSQSSVVSFFGTRMIRRLKSAGRSRESAGARSSGSSLGRSYEASTAGLVG
jgi:hypothetical protein